MKLDLVSWKGTNFSPNYLAWTVYPKPLRMPVNAEGVEIAGRHAEYTGKSQGLGYLTIQIRYEDGVANVHARETEIARWFNTNDETPYELLAQDTADSNRQWYVMATPLSITQSNNSAVILMVLDDPYWAVKTVSTSSWNVTTSPTTKAVTNLGEVARPKFTITPTSSKTGGFLYKRFVEVTLPSTIPGVSNYPVNLGPLNTSSLVSGGKCQSDGDDFQVMLNGTLVSRWFGTTGTTAFNQTGTNIWTILNLKPSVTLTLGAAIASTGTITQIVFQTTNANLTSLKALPNQGIIKIVTGGNTEYFTYTAKDLVNYRLTGITRNAKDSAMAAHNIGDTCTWIQWDLWFVYGNASYATYTPPTNLKPIINLDTSTNTSWVYDDFISESYYRTGSWNNGIFASGLKNAYIYTKTQDDFEDPATAAGCKMATMKVNGIEKPETSGVGWVLFQQCGMTGITTVSGKKYRYSTAWPSTLTGFWVRGLHVSGLGFAGGRKTIQTIATPSSSGAWENFSYGPLSFSGTYNELRFQINGTLPALAGNWAAVEMLSITVALNSSNTPSVTIRSENSQYYLTLKLSNTTTGEALYLNWPMKLNETLVLDCDTRRITYRDNTSALGALTLDSERVDWLNMANGSNTFQWEDSSTVAVTVAIEWKDKVSV